MDMYSSLGSWPGWLGTAAQLTSFLGKSSLGGTLGAGWFPARMVGGQGGTARSRVRK